MKSYSALVLCTPVLGHELNVTTSNVTMPMNDVSNAVPELNAFSQSLYNLPLVNLTEGVYDISIGENGTSKGCYVNMHYKWDIIKKDTINEVLDKTKPCTIGAAIGVVWLVVHFAVLGMSIISTHFGRTIFWATARGLIFGGTASLFIGLVNILAGSLIEEDSLLLTKVPTLQNWKLVSKPTGFPGTFELETIRNGKGHALNVSFFGLKTPLAWALRARLDSTSLIDMKANETLVVLEFIDLTNNITQWVSFGESRFDLSNKKVTPFVFSHTEKTMALSVQNLRAHP